MDDRFFNAFLPPTVRIAGRSLTAYTLWHQLLLSAINSPLITGTGVIRPSDLLAAIKCCQSQYGSPPALSPTLTDAFWTWRYKRKPSMFRQHCRMFYKWATVQCSPPKYWVESRGDQKTATLDRTPHSLALACTLMARAGLPRADAWDTPHGEALWIDAQLARMEGAKLHFLDDTDIEDEPTSLADMTEDQALATFRRNLPETIAQATFAQWKLERSAHHA